MEKELGWEGRFPSRQRRRQLLSALNNSVVAPRPLHPSLRPRPPTPSTPPASPRASRSPSPRFFPLLPPPLLPFSIFLRPPAVFPFRLPLPRVPLSSRKGPQRRLSLSKTVFASATPPTALVNPAILARSTGSRRTARYRTASFSRVSALRRRLSGKTPSPSRRVAGSPFFVS